MFLDWILLIKLLKSLTEKILAISFLTILISTSTSNSSLSKENRLVKASRSDMLLYGQIFSNYFCIARRSKVKFDDAISIAANNLTAIIINKHGGLLEELDGKTITPKQLLNGSSNVIVESAVLTCPDKVPEKIERKVRKTIEQRAKSLQKEIKEN
ncbi:hypothetical protein [Prochlorococcus marinus]|uniref:hypothetical protein n=1 Tax=Prochlorococcus marinus TaxID=1219 RepID=UPI0022B3084A|nr:hypothetical protein [Prochlorococcus marinus]